MYRIEKSTETESRLVVAKVDGKGMDKWRVPNDRYELIFCMMKIF